MKNKNKMHESLIGKIIYGFLMFMPLLSILTSCLYVVFNPNAKDSYSAINYQKEYLDTDTAPILNALYSYNNEIQYGTSARKRIYLENTEYIRGNLSPTYINQLINCEYIEIWYDSGANTNYITGTNITTNLSAITNQFTIKANITGVSTNIKSQNLNDKLIYREINIGESLDNVFDEATLRIEENPLYNWTTQTGTYQIIELTTTTLQIDNSFVNLLLTYWLLITIIYIIYDIALIMVLLVHKKVHELIDR